MADSPEEDKFPTQLLSCPICYREYDSPKVLPCLHVFCEGCLHRHFMLTKPVSYGRLLCPTCKLLIPLPVNAVGVDSLRNDEIVGRCQDVFGSLSVPFEVCGKEKCLENNNREFAKLSDAQLKKFFKVKTETIELIQELKDYTVNLPNDLLALHEALFSAKNNWKEELKRVQKVLIQHPEVPDANVDKQITKREKSKDDLTKKYAIVFEWIANEQDILYQRVVHLKPVTDVAGEIIEKGSCSLVSKIGGALKELLEQTLVLAETSPSNRPKPADYDKLVKKNDKLQFQGLKSSNSCKKQSILEMFADDIPDPKKLTCKLISKIYGTGSKPGKFNCPMSCAFAPNGDIMVADKNNFRLQVFDPSGTYKGELFKGKIKPTRVCINPTNSTFYINEENATSIKVFSADGSELTGLEGGAHWSSNLLFHTFDSDGNIIMTNPNQYTVSIHQRDSGDTINTFSFNCLDHVNDENAPPPPPTTNPHALTVTKEDHVLLAETKDNRVQMFTHDGDYVFSITNLMVPKGLCADQYGNIFIVEGDAHRILLYNKYGRFVKVLLTERDGLKSPVCVEICDGKLAVTQYGGHMPHGLLVFHVNYHKQTVL